MSDQMRCERCRRFVGRDALEGWDGGLFGDYNGLFYCAAGKGCNADLYLDEEPEPPLRLAAGSSQEQR